MPYGRKEVHNRKLVQERRVQRINQVLEDDAKKSIFPLDRLSGTCGRTNAWVPDVSVQMCATSVPAGARDRASAFDHVKEGDSLQSTG